MFTDYMVIARFDLHYYNDYNKRENAVHKIYNLTYHLNCIIKAKDSLYGTQYYNSPYLSIERTRYFA